MESIVALKITTAFKQHAAVPADVKLAVRSEMHLPLTFSAGGCAVISEHTCETAEGAAP